MCLGDLYVLSLVVRWYWNRHELIEVRDVVGLSRSKRLNLPSRQTKPPLGRQTTPIEFAITGNCHGVMGTARDLLELNLRINDRTWDRNARYPLFVVHYHLVSDLEILIIVQARWTRKVRGCRFLFGGLEHVFLLGRVHGEPKVLPLKLVNAVNALTKLSADTQTPRKEAPVLLDGHSMRLTV